MLDMCSEPKKYLEEALIRIVEIRSHSLGLDGLKMIAVLELVSMNIEKESLRFLCLNVETIVQAVRNLREDNELIEVIDAVVSYVFIHNLNLILSKYRFF